MDGTLCRQLERELNAEKQHVTELENRLRALWDKYDGDRNHYMDRIKRLEKALDEVYHAGRVGASLRAKEEWLRAKEAKP
jgi:hypothetical protein